MIGGTIYGVALNDSAELVREARMFHEPPYKAPPSAPVVYIKPRNCPSWGGAPVPLPAGCESLRVAPTLALILGRDMTSADETALSGVAAICIAADIGIPHSFYYRPPISQICRDGFLPLGRETALAGDPAGITLTTSVDGRIVHRFPLSRLARPAVRLIADLSAFMTLRAGDMLLLGLPGDAPAIGRGQIVTIAADGLPSLTTYVVAEDPA